MLKYRLGLDLGTNSLGWALLELNDENEPCKVVRIGSRIFSDGRNPKDGRSLAEQRRGPRQMRRQRDRYLRRRERFLSALTRYGLMPSDPSERQKIVALNPWRLRAEALERKLEPYEVGRALFHLQQRRGFKSNRKVDRTGDDASETEGLKGAISEFRQTLGERTVGQELWERIQRGENARARLVGSGKDARYTFYVDRAMVAFEFDKIWQAQAAYSPETYTEAARESLRDTLLFQRDLLAPVVGKCFFFPSEERIALSRETSQLFRLYQEVNHLRLIDRRTYESRPLTLHERDTLVENLLTAKEKTFVALRKVILKDRRDEYVFSLEKHNRTKLTGDQVGAQLSNKKGFGRDDWLRLTVEQRDEVARLVDEVENERVLVEYLHDEYGRSQEQAEWISAQVLPEGHLHVGRSAAQMVLEQLQTGWDVENDKPLTYDQAVAASGIGNHSRQDSGALYDKLPYYGEILNRYTVPAETSPVTVEAEWGKIGNPTVHLGLNQVRKVVNALIQRFGKPTEIVVEVGRDLKNNEYTKTQIEKRQKEGIERNNGLRSQLADFGVRDNAENRMRMRLYNELLRHGDVARCVYSGRTISAAQLFSNEYQVDHILPLSRTLDDGYANKILVHHSANRIKANRSPYEAFGMSPEGFEWEEILKRASESLPQNKSRRFSPGAMAQIDEEGGFLARQLTDTQYLSRLAGQYLESLFDDRHARTHVWVTPGRLTGLLRAKWGLNSVLDKNNVKNRDDHRHHAIDAAVIAVTDRALLQRVSTSARKAQERDLDRYFEDFPDPWESFRSEVAVAASRVVVSHKPDHGTGSRLHNDTAYGIIEGPDEKGIARVQHRVPLTTVTEKNLPAMDLSGPFRARVEDALLASVTEKERVRALQELADSSKRRSVRKVETLSVVPIYPKGMKDDPGVRPYKAYKGDSNYCYEIFIGPNGKWKGEVISSFLAASDEYCSFMKSPRFRREAWNGRELVMRIMPNDYVALTMQDGDELVRVQKISEGMIALAAPNEANVDARNRSKDDLFSFIYKAPGALQKTGARRVFVDPLGGVRDPGPKEE